MPIIASCDSEAKYDWFRRDIQKEIDDVGPKLEDEVRSQLGADKVFTLRAELGDTIVVEGVRKQLIQVLVIVDKEASASIDIGSVTGDYEEGIELNPTVVSPERITSVARKLLEAATII